jgi:AcrR family transcriptional regulator
MMAQTTRQGKVAAEAPRRREPLTRERIVDTALRVMDQEGLEAVTMRRIGRELGVEAMSLYNHVSDKEDILSGVVEAVMAGFAFPDDDREEWTERARDAARAWRRLLLAHPNVITLMSEQRKPMTSIQAMRPTDRAIGILRGSGLPDDEAVAAFRAFGGFIQGFVLAEVANMFGGGDVAMRPEDISDALPVGELPNLARASSHLYACDLDETFEYGLDLMIRGVESKAATIATV